MKRRQFMGSLPCSALGSLGVTNTLLNLRMINNAVAAPPAGPGDYRALVCVYLGGGNDSYNMLVPTETSEYNNYAAIRSNLALPAPDPMNADALLPLSVSNTPGRTFGVHGAMPNLQTRFNAGDAAFVANVGTLVQPTTLTEFQNQTVPVPRSLFSHNDQTLIWQTSVAQGVSKTGWGGRLADNVMANNTSNQVSMNISLQGNKIFLTGDSNFAYAISRDGATLLTGAGGNATNEARVTAAKSIVEETQRNVLKRAFSQEKTRSYDTGELFATAYNSTSLTTTFGSGSLSGQLEGVARTIAASSALGHKRQVFFVELGGFDNHDELLNNQASLLGNVDLALGEFWDAMVELNLTDEVTLFSSSDFGRTIRSNGLGTDHAWGGNSFVMGGGVNGAKIYGTYPDDMQLGIGSGLDVGFNGRLLPTTSVDEYFSELALWFGLPPGDLVEVFPQITNFGNFTPASPPIGFLLD